MKQKFLKDLGIDIDKYKTAVYDSGLIYNDHFETFDDVINIGVVQIYYPARDFDLTIQYLDDEDVLLNTRTIQINDTMFLSDPPLAAIIDVNAERTEGYIFDAERSYGGDVSLGALIANAPIKIYYKPVDQIRTKTIILRYRQEL